MTSNQPENLRSYDDEESGLLQKEGGEKTLHVKVVPMDPALDGH